MLIVFFLAAFASIAGMCLFILGSLGFSSYRLPRRLPARSPVDFMHLGSTLFSFGFFSIVLTLLIYGLLK